MTGLIEEIQRGAADQTVPVDATLRRVKIAATKLQLSTLESWVTEELNGYRGEVPDYRKLTGQPAAWNPVNGWIPIHISNARLMEIVSTVPVAQSVGSLIDSLNNCENGLLNFPLPPALVIEMNRILNYQTPRAVVQLGRGHVVSIVDTVRDMVLDWALSMEAKGIVGDGLSFTEEEKVQAKNQRTTIKISRIENFAGNLGSDLVARDVTLTAENKTNVFRLANELESSFDNLVLMGADEKRLRSALNQFKSEIATESPRSSKIQLLLEDIRAALAGATGNLLAEGAKSMIGAALRAFG